MGPGIDYLEAEPAQMVLDLLILVVAGAVEKQYGLLPEVGAVPLELDRQLGQVEPHDVGIGIDLSQGHIGIALRVHGRYHRDPGAHLFGRYAIPRTLSSPFAVDVLDAGDPGLIDVDDALALLDELQHLDCESLSKNQVPLIIAPEAQFVAELVLEAHVAAENLPDLMDRRLDLIMELAMVLDEGGPGDVLVQVEQGLGGMGDLLDLVLLSFHLRPDLIEVVLVL